MRVLLASLSLLLVCASGCEQDDQLNLFEDPNDPANDPDDAIWGSAELVVLSPLPGDLFFLEDDAVFEAIIVDEDGDEIEFDEIEWSSDIDSGFALVGSEGEEQLEPGQHVISARAVLPNGDRLVHAVGGVRVQSQWAGIYSGSLEVSIAGGQFETGCSGGISFTVDVYGETLEGEGNCSANLFGAPVDIELGVVGEVGRDGDITGALEIAVGGFFDVPVEFEGRIDDDGEASGAFEASVFVADVAGSFSARRLD